MLLIRISGANKIARRYFVVNGFDGALTMLGLLMGFIFSASEHLLVVINACLGAAIALGVSGVSSAYISESAERRRELTRLEEAMLADLGNSYHATAAKWVPILVAVVNGLAPFVIALMVILPLWIARLGVPLPGSPLHIAVGVAFVAVFLLGVFLGRIEQVPWFRSGVRTLLIACFTALLIFLVT
jgi:predicted membrane protein (TIGR00267 family)